VTVGLVIIGAGGFGRESTDVARAMSAATTPPPFELLGVLDSAPSDINLGRLTALGIAYLGKVEDFEFSPDRHAAVIGIGNPAARERVAARLAPTGVGYLTLVHPSATLGSASRLGKGVVICAGVQVSTNVTIGDHAHLNPGAIIGHDTTIGDFVSVNPGAVVSGDVTVSSGTLIGASSVVLQGLAIGRGALVGAGACVTRDVDAGRVVKGVPAR